MANKFEMKSWELDEYGRIYAELEERVKDLGYKWGKLETQHQDYDWVDGKKELLWEDEEKTIPKMAYDWGNIELSEDEITDDIRAKRKVCEAIMAFIDKQI